MDELDLLIACVVVGFIWTSVLIFAIKVIAASIDKDEREWHDTNDDSPL